MPWRGPEESPRVVARDRPHGTVRPGRVDRPGWCTPMVPSARRTSCPPAVADWLASVFEDRKSYSGTFGAVQGGVAGELSGSAALDLRAGDGSEGKEPGSNLHGCGASERVIGTWISVTVPILGVSVVRKSGVERGVGG